MTHVSIDSTILVGILRASLKGRNDSGTKYDAALNNQMITALAFNGEGVFRV